MNLPSLFKVTLAITLIGLSSIGMCKHYILTLDLHGWTTPDNQSEGNLLLNRYLEYTDLEVEVISMPSARAIQEIRKSNFHCILAGSKSTFLKYTNRESIEVEDLQTSFWRYITPDNQPIITDLNQLIGLNLVTLNGMILNKTSLHIDPKHLSSLDTVNNVQTIGKMLSFGRVRPNGRLVPISLKENEVLPGFHYEASLNTTISKRGLNCAKDYELSAELIEDFSQFMLIKESKL